jgi:UDP-2,3-diacylglucosamine pyrophosphatase LpxH
MTSYRTIFLSDLHLGMRGCQAERVLDFVRHHQAERWVLVGDVVDGWALTRSWTWQQVHNDVVQKLLREVRKGAEMVYVPGNHDGAARQFVGLTFGGILVQRDWVHTTADGRKLLVLHGDEFDGVVRLAPWLSRVGARAYELSLALNTVVARVRERMGKPYWSLAAALKDRTKRALQYIDRFEEAVAARAVEAGVDGVVCGHIHRPELRDVVTEAGATLYANCGDWVENCTALVEHWDGRLEIVRWTGPIQRAASEPSGDGVRHSVADLAPRLALGAEAAGLGLDTGALLGTDR